jgi:hypothetical protein
MYGIDTSSDDDRARFLATVDRKLTRLARR